MFAKSAPVTPAQTTPNRRVRGGNIPSQSLSSHAEPGPGRQAPRSAPPPAPPPAPRAAQPQASVPRVRRRTVSQRLQEALHVLAQGHARIDTHSMTAWASATFSGARHRLDCVFSGAPAMPAGEAFIDALPDHEFAVPGQIVIEALVVAVDHRLVPDPVLTVTVELLLVEEC